jgi:prolyl oligopeptidase
MAHRSFLLSLLFLVSLAPAVGSDTVPPAPVARIEPVTDSYFGETVTDPYRWMENDRDPEWLPYLRSQNAHARGVLEALPQRGELLARIQALSGDAAMPARLQRAGGRLFFQQRPAGANNFKLFMRAHGKDRVLVDPTRQDHAGTHVSLDWWVASPDGRRLAYGLSRDGSEDSVLHVMDVPSGIDLAERIPDTQGANPQWLDDSSGFFYNQLTGKVDTPERYLDSRARFHRLGSDPARDPILMRRGQDPAVDYENIQAPEILTFPGSDKVLLQLHDVRLEARYLISGLRDALAGRAHWQPVADFSDEITDIDLHGDRLLLLANQGHPRGHILQTSVRTPDLAHASELVPEGTLVLQQLARARDGVYLRSMDGGLGRLQKLEADGRRKDIPLPFDGSLSALSTDPANAGALFRLSGWLEPTAIWSIDATGRVIDTHITPRPAIDIGPYAAERHYATASDGARIPYSLIYRKDLKLDGSHPAFISAYGSYGAVPYAPTFAGRLLALVDQGAVVGFANVRGGGEYGRDWHRAGQFDNKPNTWRDLIAVCEDSIARGYTSASHLAIGGRSAGGITMGQAMNERPELFAAVVSGVGWHNPLRYVAEQNGYGEEPEWGAINDPAGYRSLKAIDSYQGVKDGVPYPAVLLTTGVTDPRVAPFHPGKMAARLQAASSSGKPVLLRVDFDAGHGMGSTRSQQDQEAADTYAFILAQTRGSGR